MDEVSSHVCLDLLLQDETAGPKRSLRPVLETHDGRAVGYDSEEKHEPASDIDTVAMDSLKALNSETAD